MVYNWDGKEAECYRLYVEERRSLDEVVEYWAQEGFTPRYVLHNCNNGPPYSFPQPAYGSRLYRDSAEKTVQR